MGFYRMKILITGVVGFIGSHIAEFYAKQGYNVIGIDNFSRNRLLNTIMKNTGYNSEYLVKNYPNITIYNIDLRDYNNLLCFFKSNQVDVVVHCAAQTAVTTSIRNPKDDFENNAIGSFNLLEAIRQSDQSPILVYCSTNKVYGNNVNALFDLYPEGMNEITPIDLTSHSPYGVSKLAADLYFQEYSYTYGFRTGVFRMSCIYGPRQFGVEDQGWVMHFILSALNNKKINIYGNGKQVRDILYVSDLVDAFDTFILRYNKSNVFNIGGGSQNTLSLLELIKILEDELDKEIKYEFYDWRESDQKVYISDITKAQKELGFVPKISPKKGIKKVLSNIT